MTRPSPSPMDFKTAEDYSCWRRWPFFLATLTSLVLGFVLLFATPTTIESCSSSEGNCSRRGTREVKQLHFVIPAGFLIVLGVLLFVVSYRKGWKVDRKEFKEAHKKMHRQQSNEMEKTEGEADDLELPSSPASVAPTPPEVMEHQSQRQRRGTYSNTESSDALYLTLCPSSSATVGTSPESFSLEC